MKGKKNGKVVIGCSIVVAICFGIVSIPEHTIHAGCLILIALFFADCFLSFMFRTPITY